MAVEPVRYALAGATFEGLLVYDGSVATRRPALLVAPNAMGATEAAAERARTLAGTRYVVLVADMYGLGRRPRNAEEAGALANPIRSNPLEARRRIGAAFVKLIEEGQHRQLIDPTRRAAVGFGFGGGNVLELARSGAGLQAVVSIHGYLTSTMPARYGDIKAAVLAIHGAADPIVPKSERDAFEAEMERVNATWQCVVFGGQLHGFAEAVAEVPGKIRYDAPAARKTFDLVHAFIADAFSARR